MESRPNKEPSSKQSCPIPDQSAKHPRREKRTDNIDLWSHRTPRCALLERFKVQGSRFKVPSPNPELGTRNPKQSLWRPGGKRKRCRSIEQLNLGVQLHEPGATQLAPSGQKIYQRIETSTVRFQRGLVGTLGSIHQRRRNVKATYGEPDVRVCLPHVPNSLVAGSCYFCFRRPTLGLSEFDLSLGGPALEEVPLQKEPCAAARLGGTEPSRRLISSSDFDPPSKRVDIGHQRECREIGCARAPHVGFLSAKRRHLGDQVRSSFECLVDHIVDGIFQNRRRRQGREFANLDRCRGRNADALRQRHLGIAFSRQHILQIESGLGFLLPRLRDFRNSCQTIAHLRFRRLADRTGGIDGALRNCNLPPQAGQPEKCSLNIEDDLLVLAIKAKISCQQALLGRVPGAPSAAKVEEQPAQVEGRKNLVHGETKETAWSDILGSRESLALVTPKRRQRKHREVFALDQSNRNGSLARRFPRDTRLGVHALSDVDKLDKIVTLVGVDG